jgi:hypothetical protein
MLNQSIAAMQRIANERAHFLQRQLVSLSAFELTFATNRFSHLVDRGHHARSRRI